MDQIKMKGEPVRVDGEGTRTEGPGATRRARLAFTLWPQTKYVSRFNELMMDVQIFLCPKDDFWKSKDHDCSIITQVLTFFSSL